MVDNLIQRFEELAVENKALKDQNNVLLNHLQKHGLLVRTKDNKLELLDELPRTDQPISDRDPKENPVQADGEQATEGVDTKKTK